MDQATNTAVWIVLHPWTKPQTLQYGLFCTHGPSHKHCSMDCLAHMDQATLSMDCPKIVWIIRLITQNQMRTFSHQWHLLRHVYTEKNSSSFLGIFVDMLKKSNLYASSPPTKSDDWIWFKITLLSHEYDCQSYKHSCWLNWEKTTRQYRILKGWLW